MLCRIDCDERLEPGITAMIPHWVMTYEFMAGVYHCIQASFCGWSEETESSLVCGDAGQAYQMTDGQCQPTPGLWPTPATSPPPLPRSPRQPSSPPRKLQRRWVQGTRRLLTFMTPPSQPRPKLRPHQHPRKLVCVCPSSDILALAYPLGHVAIPG